MFFICKLSFTPGAATRADARYRNVTQRTQQLIRYEWEKIRSQSMPFLTRDATLARHMLSSCIYPSVCLSVRLVLRQNGWTKITKTTHNGAGNMFLWQQSHRRNFCSLVDILTTIANFVNCYFVTLLVSQCFTKRSSHPAIPSRLVMHILTLFKTR